MQTPVSKWFFLILCALTLGSEALSQVVDNIRIVGNGAPTRVTIWTDEPVDHRMFLSGGVDRQNIIIAMPHTAWGGTPAIGGAMGGVARYEWEQGLLTLRLDRPMKIIRTLDLPPAGSERRHRIILDLDTITPANFAREADPNAQWRAQAHVSNAPVTMPERVITAAAGEHKFTVVIDPGHGGRDPGASKHGAIEKDVVLKSALTLKALLESDPRYEVYLTREDDRYIPHGQRVTLARNWGADLFISIHADAAASPGVAGASVYTLSQRGKARIDKEAAENHWELPIEDGATEEVSGILTDFLKRETSTKSVEFAEVLIPELAKAGPVLRNTHRNAGLYVLLAPDVPAVLVEIGFLTSQADAKRLESAGGRRKSMKAIKRGIDAYVAAQPALFAKN